METIYVFEKHSVRAGMIPTQADIARLVTPVYDAEGTFIVRWDTSDDLRKLEFGGTGEARDWAKKQDASPHNTGPDGSYWRKVGQSVLDYLA